MLSCAVAVNRTTRAIVHDSVFVCLAETSLYWWGYPQSPGASLADRVRRTTGLYEDEMP